MIIKCAIFWDITPLVWWKLTHVTEEHRLHLQGGRTSHAINQSSACCLIHTSVLFDLIFNPEIGGSMYLRNVGWLLTGIHSVVPIKKSTSQGYCWNLKEITGSKLKAIYILKVSTLARFGSASWSTCLII